MAQSSPIQRADLKVSCRCHHNASVNLTADVDAAVNRQHTHAERVLGGLVPHPNFEISVCIYISNAHFMELVEEEGEALTS